MITTPELNAFLAAIQGRVRSLEMAVQWEPREQRQGRVTAHLLDGTSQALTVQDLRELQAFLQLLG